MLEHVEGLLETNYVCIYIATYLPPTIPVYRQRFRSRVYLEPSRRKEKGGGVGGGL